MSKLTYPFHSPQPVSQYYGENPGTYPLTSGHNGVDYACPLKTPVLCAQKIARVVRVEYDRTGYGNHVRLQDDAGELTIYGHLTEWTVKLGDVLHAGDQIGLSGNTGWSTGPHLHFEYRPDAVHAVDPLLWMDGDNGQEIDPVPDEVLFQVAVTADSLALRAQPAKTGTFIEWKPKDTVLKVYGIVGDPIWLRTDGGYVAMRYLAEGDLVRLVQD